MPKGKQKGSDGEEDKEMIDVSNHHPKRRFSKRETQRVVGDVIRTEYQKALSCSVVFVNSRFIRTVNRRFLGHDYVTDVISFSLEDGYGVDAELYVNLDRARSQATQFQASFTEEVRRLLIHGALHLVGYKDNTKNDREHMRRREDYYLARLIK